MLNIIDSAFLLHNEYKKNDNANARIVEELILPKIDGSFDNFTTYDIELEFKNAISVLLNAGNDELHGVMKRITDYILYKEDSNIIDGGVDVLYDKMCVLAISAHAVK